MESVIKSCKNKQQNLLSKQMYEAGKEAEICEFEAFVLNELCQFTGAFCNSLHCDEMGYLCRVPYVPGKKKAGKTELALEVLTDEIEEDILDVPDYICGETGCGLCALYQLQRAGITHLKLVGRGNYVNYMENDIRNLKQALEILDCAKNEADFINKMKAKLFEKGCSGNCYYETYGMKK